jgi:hypothetical protein
MVDLGRAKHEDGCPQTRVCRRRDHALMRPSSVAHLNTTSGRYREFSHPLLDEKVYKWEDISPLAGHE